MERTSLTVTVPEHLRRRLTAAAAEQGRAVQVVADHALADLCDTVATIGALPAAGSDDTPIGVAVTVRIRPATRARIDAVAALTETTIRRVVVSALETLPETDPPAPPPTPDELLAIIAGGEAPPPKTPAKKAAATKRPAKKPSTRKSPAKRAPAKKPAAAKPSPPSNKPTPPPPPAKKKLTMLGDLTDPLDPR